MEETRLIKTLGFDGKSIINPRQVKPIHSVFTPTQKELEKSLNVLRAIREANARGSGVASLKGKMVDRPVVLRALRMLTLAKASGRVEILDDPALKEAFGSFDPGEPSWKPYLNEAEREA